MKLKYWYPVVLAVLMPSIFSFVGCGGAFAGGLFSYGKKFIGTAGDGNAAHHSDFYILLDGEGNIVSAQSYSGQGPRCGITGSVRKTGNFLDIVVQLTVPVNNASCSNIVLSGSGQLTYNSETKWWTGEGTGTFSDAPNNIVPMGFSLAQNDEWE